MMSVKLINTVLCCESAEQFAFIIFFFKSSFTYCVDVALSSSVVYILCNEIVNRPPHEKSSPIREDVGNNLILPYLWFYRIFAGFRIGSDLDPESLAQKCAESTLKNIY